MARKSVPTPEQTSKLFKYLAAETLVKRYALLDKREKSIARQLVERGETAETAMQHAYFFGDFALR